MTVLRWQRLARGSVTIALNVQPRTAANLGFLGALGAFALDDPASDDGDTTTNTRTFSVAPGVYTVRRSNTATWFTMAIDCTPTGKAVVNLAARRVDLTVAAGDNVTCTFTEARGVTIRARMFNDLVRTGSNLGKRNAADPWLNNWPMSVATAPTAIVASGVTQPTTTANLYQATFTNLRPGTYTVCTTLPNGSWTPTQPTTLDPAYSRPCKPVMLTGGQSATLLFGAYQPTAPAGAFSTVDEVVTDEDQIVAPPLDPSEDETDASDGTVRQLFLPLLYR
jgi:hypothetical protein